MSWYLVGVNVEYQVRLRTHLFRTAGVGQATIMFTVGVHAVYNAQHTIFLFNTLCSLQVLSIHEP